MVVKQPNESSIRRRWRLLGGRERKSDAVKELDGAASEARTLQRETV
jgi:hypothetical protein